MDSWGVPPGMSGGLKWRVGLSILLGIGWLSFVLIWLLFFADGFSIYRNLAILFLSLLLTGAVLTATWLTMVCAWRSTHRLSAQNGWDCGA